MAVAKINFHDEWQYRAWQGSWRYNKKRYGKITWLLFSPSFYSHPLSSDTANIDCENATTGLWLLTNIPIFKHHTVSTGPLERVSKMSLMLRKSSSDVLLTTTSLQTEPPSYRRAGPWPGFQDEKRRSFVASLRRRIRQPGAWFMDAGWQSWLRALWQHHHVVRNQNRSICNWWLPFLVQCVIIYSSVRQTLVVYALHQCPQVTTQPTHSS